MSSFSRKNIRTRSGRPKPRISDNFLVLRETANQGVLLRVMERHQPGNTNKQTNETPVSIPFLLLQATCQPVASCLWPGALLCAIRRLCRVCSSRQEGGAHSGGESHRGHRLQSHTGDLTESYPPSCAQRFPLSISRTQGKTGCW